MLNKNKFTKQIRQHFNLNHSEYVSELTSNIMKEAIIFTDGFLACVKIISEEPIREEEVEKLIFDETIKYIIKKIDGV